ncbi:MAG: hypothetical protein P8L85_04245 [Rubripirellula sp.]|nr:hypothetical protein [Rubripirellula sp.]
MPSNKIPTLLVVVVLSEKQQWFVAGISLVDGAVDCLVRSEPANLDAYVGGDADEQLSFLRHRLSGAMQRGFDRLWGNAAKASRIVLIADQELPDSTPELLPRLAEHLGIWMTRPPIVFFQGKGSERIECFSELQLLAGQLEATEQTYLEKQLPTLQQKLADPTAWEVIAKPRDSS